MIKIQWLASIWRQNDQNKAKLQKWSKLQKLSKSNDLHRFYVNTIKMLSYVAKHSKQRKTTKWPKSNDLHFKTIKKVELRRKTFKTKLNYKSDLNYKSVQNSMSCIDLTSKRSKMLSYVAKHSKQRKTTKPIKLQWIASIGCQNDQNKPKLQKWSESNDLQVKTIKKLSYVARHSKQS